jgi:hypothetical protein
MLDDGSLAPVLLLVAALFAAAAVLLTLGGQALGQAIPAWLVGFMCLAAYRMIGARWG